MGACHVEMLSEIQCYASNVNFAIKLLQSPCGVDFDNVLDGPSNALERLNFFDEVLQEVQVTGVQCSALMLCGHG